MNHAVRAGVTGFIIAAIINIMSPTNLYFFPQLIVAIIVIYAFGLREIKDGLLAAFTTYIFNDWLVGTITLALFFISGESVTVTVDAGAVLIQLVIAPTALLAGLVGSRLARTKPTTVPTPPPPPPIQPV